VTGLAKERASFLKMNDIYDMSLFRTWLSSLFFYSVSGKANSMEPLLTCCLPFKRYKLPSLRTPYYKPQQGGHSTIEAYARKKISETALYVTIGVQCVRLKTISMAGGLII
jgi:hypothetical protein